MFWEFLFFQCSFWIRCCICWKYLEALVNRARPLEGTFLAISRQVWCHLAQHDYSPTLYSFQQKREHNRKAMLVFNQQSWVYIWMLHEPLNLPLQKRINIDGEKSHFWKLADRLADLKCFLVVIFHCTFFTILFCSHVKQKTNRI